MFQPLSKPKWIRVAVYGPPRSGKTWFAASAPRPAFIVPENENSDVSISHLRREDGTPFPVVKVRKIDDMNKVLDYLMALAAQNKLNQLCDTVVASSLSHWAECVEMELTESGKTTMRGNWDRVSAHFKHIKDVLWQLPAHVIVDAQDFVRATPEGLVIKAGARLPGQIADNFFSSVDVLAYTEQVMTPKGPVWQAHVCNKPPFIGGTRLPGMPQGIYLNFNWRDHIAPFVATPAEQTKGG